MDEKNKEFLHRIVVLGNGGVGKSSLILQFLYNEFPETYVPTKSDVFQKPVEIDGNTHHIHILDTAGEEQYSGTTQKLHMCALETDEQNTIYIHVVYGWFPELRDGYITNADGFLCICSLMDRETFISLGEFIKQIIRIHNIHESVTQELDVPPVILVGNKLDLAKVDGRKVEADDLEEMAREWGGIEFVETSAKVAKNAEKIFMQLVRRIVEKKEFEREKSKLISEMTANEPKIFCLNKFCSVM